MPRLRAAIYTRKSTEDGLDQSFNSLDAQREACSAYIVSQRHEGWVETAETYDDGGFSGGNMDRPGLAALMEAVRARKIDVIVVYKVDRLTRSLADFARIVALLDKYEASFVSVTQQFNTTSSMGRLTLNVLLSFAQFEREVTAERIRDKIAASKKKGLWTGGPVPLGYDVKDKALVPNPEEAETVKRLFRMYLGVGSVRELEAAAAATGILTKRRKGVGRRAADNPFGRGALYTLLSNQTYVGRIGQKGAVYEGQHPAIVDETLWDAVQAKLKAAGPKRRSASYIASKSCLAGLLFDETGDRLTLAQAHKTGRRYRYYVSRRLHLGQDRTGWRLPASMLEALIIDILAKHLADPSTFLQQIPAGTIDSLLIGDVHAAAADAGGKLIDSDSSGQASLISELVARIDLAADTVCIHLRPEALALPGDLDISLTEAVSLPRRGVEAKFVLQQGVAAQTPDLGLIQIIARSHRWRERLVSGEHATLSALAEAEGVSRWDVNRHLPLTFLAPDIVQAILEGRHPVGLTVNKLKRALPLPLDWRKQRMTLDFSA